MDIERRVVRALETLDLVDPEITIFEDQGSRITAGIVSPSFRSMEDADRQSMILGKLFDELGDHDSRKVGYVITSTPEEVAESIAKANEVSHQI